MKTSLLMVFFCLVALIVGCGGFHNVVVNRVSEVDQRKIVEFHVNEACKYNKLFYKSFWDSSLPNGKIVFIVAVKNAVKLTKGESLDIFVDGKKYSYKSVGDNEESKKTYAVTTKYALSPTTTDISESTITYIPYLIDLTVVDKIINSKNTGIKINLINNLSIEDMIVDKKMLTEFKADIDKSI